MVTVSDQKAAALLAQQEGHFLDFKAKEIAPARLTQTISAFANAEGGDIYIGVAEGPDGFVWDGFENAEAANPFVLLFEQLFPLGDEFSYELIANANRRGLLLHVSARRTSRVMLASDGNAYIRRNAQKIRVDSDEAKRRLELDKGIYSFEAETVDIDVSVVSDSRVMGQFLASTIPDRTPAEFLAMELLVRRELPRVAAVLLFSDLPQAALPDRSSVKIARYRTSGVATREALVGPAETVEGPVYDLIYDAVDRTRRQIEAHQVQGERGLEPAKYPHETLHEIIANAVLHRDYSIPDHVHIRVFDNRVEVESPGRLPGQVTTENILNTRAIRNGKLVRLINKFPNPPNKDMGEGLNTAAEAMRNVRLRAPRFIESPTSFTVVIPHEPLATAEEMILRYLEQNESITNRKARELYPVDTQHIMRTIMARMVDQGLIERVEGTQRGGVRYRKKL
jgi:ATP-dependent DNA helicase RecG